MNGWWPSDGGRGWGLAGEAKEEGREEGTHRSAVRRCPPRPTARRRPTPPTSRGRPAQSPADGHGAAQLYPMTARGRRQGGRHDQQPGSEAHRGRPSHAAVATGNGLSQGCGWLGTGLHALVPARLIGFRTAGQYAPALPQEAQQVATHRPRCGMPGRRSARHFDELTGHEIPGAGRELDLDARLIRSLGCAADARRSNQLC